MVGYAKNPDNPGKSCKVGAGIADACSSRLALPGGPCAQLLLR